METAQILEDLNRIAEGEQPTRGAMAVVAKLAADRMRELRDQLMAREVDCAKARELLA